MKPKFRMANGPVKAIWHVYIIKCKDETLYTGITTDLTRRIKMHNTGCGCRFTKYRHPVKLIYSEEQPDKNSALKREAQIKSFPRNKKIALINEIQV